jgi:hypothetical protein
MDKYEIVGFSDGKETQNTTINPQTALKASDEQQKHEDENSLATSIPKQV